ncbi:MAG: AAA family ATPase, partial [Solirubrobacterales bacterium]|nr:AAA family ATPase [Solirubrobacterales bacterium]
EDGREHVRITTARAVDLERETIALAEKAAADKSGALTPEAIERAVQRVSERDGLVFTDAYGREQRRIIDALGMAGRLGVAVGVGGAGKTTLLSGLVEAWREQGREVYGAALAWRQSDPLADAGVDPANSMALAAFLARAEAGRLRLGPDAVVIVDELSQVGTQQALALMRLRDKHGFTLIGIGDPLRRSRLGTASLSSARPSARRACLRSRAACARCARAIARRRSCSARGMRRPGWSGCEGTGSRSSHPEAAGTRSRLRRICGSSASARTPAGTTTSSPSQPPRTEMLTT